MHVQWKGKLFQIIPNDDGIIRFYFRHSLTGSEHRADAKRKTDTQISETIKLHRGVEASTQLCSATRKKNAQKRHLFWQLLNLVSLKMRAQPPSNAFIALSIGTIQLSGKESTTDSRFDSSVLYRHMYIDRWIFLDSGLALKLQYDDKHKISENILSMVDIKTMERSRRLLYFYFNNSSFYNL